MDKIQLPVQLESVRDLSDRSCKLTFVTRELINEEFNVLRDLRGQEGWILFGLNQFQESDLPKEIAEVESKTPSQRLRSVLFVLYKQEKSELDFEVWYRAKMESIILHIKNKLQ